MATMLIALLAVVLPALQTETAQTATMQSDVDRLARAAEGLEAAANNRGAIAELEMWLTHDDRHLRDNVAFVLRRLDEAFLFAQSIDATSYEPQRDRLREERTLAQINPGLRRTRSAARLRPLGPGVARLQAAAAAAVLSGKGSRTTEFDSIEPP